ncbi:unnamed protein product [Ixodes persulcatus]
MTKTGATRWMLCLLWGSCVRTAPGVPPNIVVFVADDLECSTMSSTRLMSTRSLCDSR